MLHFSEIGLSAVAILTPVSSSLCIKSLACEFTGLKHGWGDDVYNTVTTTSDHFLVTTSSHLVTVANH